MLSNQGGYKRNPFRNGFGRSSRNFWRVWCPQNGVDCMHLSCSYGDWDNYMCHAARPINVSPQRMKVSFVRISECAYAMQVSKWDQYTSAPRYAIIAKIDISLKLDRFLSRNKPSWQVDELLFIVEIIRGFWFWKLKMLHMQSHAWLSLSSRLSTFDSLFDAMWCFADLLLRDAFFYRSLYI